MSPTNIEFQSYVGDVPVTVYARYAPPVAAPRCADPSAAAYSDPGDGDSVEILAVKCECGNLYEGLSEFVFAELRRQGILCGRREVMETV